MTCLDLPAGRYLELLTAAGARAAAVLVGINLGDAAGDDRPAGPRRAAGRTGAALPAAAQRSR